MSDKEQSKVEMKTAEELNSNDIEIIVGVLTQHGHYDMAADLMERFNNLIASQFKSQQSVITEDEINKQFPLTYFTGAVEVDDMSAKHKRTGAKWAIEKQRTDDRELLIRFMISLNAYGDKTCIKIVDNFLNGK